MATLAAVVNEAPQPMRRAGPLAPLITALLAKDPEARPSGPRSGPGWAGCWSWPPQPHPPAPARPPDQATPAHPRLPVLSPGQRGPPGHLRPRPPPAASRCRRSSRPRRQRGSLQGNRRRSSGHRVRSSTCPTDAPRGLVAVAGHGCPAAGRWAAHRLADQQHRGRPGRGAGSSGHHEWRRGRPGGGPAAGRQPGAAPVRPRRLGAPRPPPSGL